MDTSAAPTMLEPLLTSEELANYLQVPIKTIYEWRTNGTGPPPTGSPAAGSTPPGEVLRHG